MIKPDSWQRVLLLGLLIVVTLSGCKKYVPPDVHWKADPGEKYNIRLELESSSIDDQSRVVGYADYSVSNFTTCMMNDPWVALGGYKHEPYERVPVEVRRINKNTFATTAYINPLLDEDYYRLGTCTWSLRLVVITIEGNSGNLVIALSGTYIRPGSFEILCNEEIKLCSYLEPFSGEPRRFKASKGVVVISSQ